MGGGEKIAKKQREKSMELNLGKRSLRTRGTSELRAVVERVYDKGGCGGGGGEGGGWSWVERRWEHTRKKFEWI